ncbi:pyridoxal phosphate-dependent aminotransferase [Desulfovibrio sp. OttesenSCG-928-C14]|nr:pyridoxal phosphate-dependent aminotransferase [Desulfovibrio sp. OttesenSCG-928-C14]
MSRHNFDRILERRGTDSVKWNTYPEDVLPMWVADSDFTAPEPLVSALQKRVAHGVFGYSDMKPAQVGLAVCHWMRSRFGWAVAPEAVAFSPSVVVSLALGVLTFTRPGDGAVFLTPSYPPFFRVCEGHGRRALTSALIPDVDAPGGYRIDFADLESKMAQPGARLFILCNPHNPTGRVFSREELLRMGELCAKYDLLIISDEIHCDYVFPPLAHLPLASLSPDLARRTLTVLNPSKTFNIADLHASALISENPEYLQRFASAAQGLSLHSGALGVLALQTAYLECAWYADEARDYVKANLDFAVPYINANLPGITAYLPQSTYLLWLDCRALGLGQAELVDFFLNKAKLAMNSGTDFGPDGAGFMRMNLACPRATLLEGLKRLETALKSR